MLRWIKPKGPILLSLVALAAISLGVAACGSDDGGGSTDVAFVYAQRGDAFQEAMACGAEKKADELGVNLEVQAPAKFDPPTQIQVVDAVAAQQPDALIIAPQDSEALYAPTKAIADTGAKIVDIDEAFKNQDIVDSLVLADNEGGGRQAADIMTTLIGGSGKVLPIDLLPGLPLVNLRASGFQEQMAAEHPSVQVLPVEYDNLDPAKAASIVEATLASNPDLKGVYTTTGFGAQGAVTALREEGKLGDVKVVTFDTLPPTVNALEQGEVDAAISQRGFAEGAAAVEQAVAAVNGDPVQKRIEMGTDLVTDQNINDPNVRKFVYEEQLKPCA